MVALLDGDDIILCRITSQSISDRCGIPLDTGDFKAGALKHPGAIRPNRLFTADGGIINYRAGVIKNDELQEVIEKIIKIISG